MENQTVQNENQMDVHQTFEILRLKVDFEIGDLNYPNGKENLQEFQQIQDVYLLYRRIVIENRRLYPQMGSHSVIKKKKF